MTYIIAGTRLQLSSFVDRLTHAAQANRSLLCVGLDPDPDLMADPDVVGFNRAIIDATSDLVCAYKPNMGFYEALGLDGLRSLEKTVEYIREVAPSIVVIGDAKRGDIASSSVMYARAMFDVWGFDAATVNGYGGGESLTPFFERTNCGVLVWCRSSNPGAGELQDVSVGACGNDRHFYEQVAERAVAWNQHGNVGVVVGATYPEQLSKVRSICRDMPILLPGVGAQAGEMESAVRVGVDRHGRNLIVSSSRSVLYASKRSDFAAAARDAAADLRDAINYTLEQCGLDW